MKTKQLFKKYEKILIWIVFFFFWTWLYSFLTYHQNTHSLGDTTFVAQILYNFRHTSETISHLSVSINESIDHVWGNSAQEICNAPLIIESAKVPLFHFYFIMYPLIFVARIVDIQALLAFLQAGIYASVPIFAYLIARKNKISILNSSLFSLLVTQHPLWWQGLEGQFYFNRFFLPFAGLLILLLDKNKNKLNYLFIFLAAILAASVNEIYGVAIFLIIISYLWIYKQKNTKLFIIGLFFFITSLASIFYIQQTLGLTTTQTGFMNKIFGHGLLNAVKEITGNLTNPETAIFLVFNLISMGVFAFQNPRLILPLLIVLGPNIFMDLGGVEKTGWSTHYHLSYFIPLIWLAALGFKDIKLKKYFKSLILITLIILTGFINPQDLNKNKDFHFSIKKLINRKKDYLRSGPYYDNFKRDLRAAVGGSAVSAPEAALYHLYDHETYYYPLMIDQVDKVILLYDQSKKGDERFYSVNYGHQDPNLDICIRERMRQNGYNFDNPEIVNNWAIISKQ